MRYWLIRTDAPSINVSLDDFVVKIISRRQTTIDEGDVLLLFKKGHQASAFGQYATVSRIEIDKVMVEDRSGELTGDLSIQTQIMVEEWKKLPNTEETSIEVDDLKYSLTFVRNLLKPELHFRRGYRLLPDKDFETITLGEAFVARTGYYELLNALPTTLRVAFESEELMTSAARGSLTTFESRLSRLHEFINSRVLTVGVLLKELNLAIHEIAIRNEEGGVFEHVFIGEEGEDKQTARHAGDNISYQSKIFDDLDQTLKQPLFEDPDERFLDVVARILDELKQPQRREVERRFERLFEVTA